MGTDEAEYSHAIMSRMSKRGCLSQIAQAVGITAGIVTIATYFGFTAHSLQGWVRSLAGGRAVSRVLDSLSIHVPSWVVALAAFGAYGMIVALRLGIEEIFLWGDTISTPLVIVRNFIYFLPVAVMWLWLFQGVLSGLGVAAFFVGYTLAVGIAVYLSSLGPFRYYILSWKLGRRRY